MSWLDDIKKLAATKVLVMEQTDHDTATMRWKTCLQCERMEHTNKTCMDCGCYIETKIWSKINRTPARMLGEITHCPLGKWADKDIANHYRNIDGKEPLA